MITKTWKTIKEMDDNEVYLAYKKIENDLISLIKLSDKKPNIGLSTLIVRKESELDQFESFLSLSGRRIPEPNHFWKEETA